LGTRAVSAELIPGAIRVSSAPPDVTERGHSKADR
jgi:hypothetical protein